VTLTATPGAGSTLAGWSGCDAGGTVTMDADKTCTATFNLITRTLTVAKVGLGGGSVTSSPAGIDCGATCSASFNLSAAVTLTATPDSGSVFAGWGGACAVDGTVTMDADKACTATFKAPDLVQTLVLMNTARMQSQMGITPAQATRSRSSCASWPTTRTSSVTLWT